MRVSMDPDSSPNDTLSVEEIDLLKQRAARYSLATETQATDVTDAVIFRRGTAKYAAPLIALREVRPLRSFCPIPCTAASVPGILHFRGEILSLHDVAAFMEPNIEADTPAWVIVVEHLGERIGLAADEILDVERHSSATVQPLPITFGDRGAICDGLLQNGCVLLSPARMFHTDAFFSAF
jgi:chemotaxis signal transduction protein